LWPETAEKMGVITNKFLLRVSRKLEEHLYASSALIVGQTQGIVDNIKKRFPEKVIYWLPNGVDISLYNPDLKSDWRKRNGFAETDFILIYAGTIGQIYSWDMVFRAAEQLKQYTEIKWVIIGSGQKKEEIITLKSKMGLSSIFLFDPVPKISLPEIWKATDVLFLPLRNIEINKGVVPAKSFEAMAMKVPMLLGADGEAKKLFIDEGDAGLAFIPENEEDFISKVLFLYNNKEEKKRLGENGRKYAEQKFDRRIISDDFYNFLTSFKS
jgi:glycosyltransferase involved in cell wall biosynthesis